MLAFSFYNVFDIKARAIEQYGSTMTLLNDCILNSLLFQNHLCMDVEMLLFCDKRNIKLQMYGHCVIFPDYVKDHIISSKDSHMQSPYRALCYTCTL